MLAIIALVGIGGSINQGDRQANGANQGDRLNRPIGAAKIITQKSPKDLDTGETPHTAIGTWAKRGEAQVMIQSVKEPTLGRLQVVFLLKNCDMPKNADLTDNRDTAYAQLVCEGDSLWFVAPPSNVEFIVLHIRLATAGTSVVFKIKHAEIVWFEEIERAKKEAARAAEEQKRIAIEKAAKDKIDRIAGRVLAALEAKGAKDVQAALKGDRLTVTWLDGKASTSALFLLFGEQPSFLRVTRDGKSVAANQRPSVDDPLQGWHALLSENFK